ncbi:MAG: LacI family DNA-binding transcriptional regulator [bacterium]
MNKRNKNVTIVDIANELGVSVAMVSMVLSGKGAQHRISAEASEKVFETARKLGYKTNQMARALRTGKSFIIGLLVADISNPFFSQIARLIENEAYKYDYQVMFASSDESLEKFQKLGDAFISRQVDGMIIVPVMDSQDVIAAWYSSGIPIISIDRYFTSLNIPYAVTDNYEASFQMLEYIIRKGYNKVAFIGLESNLSNFNDREEGYRACANFLKLSPEQFAIFRLDYFNWESEINDVVEKIVKESYDIIFFGQNMLGIKGLKILNKLKVKIPEDIAIVSFDNPDVFEFNNPPVTCIEQPLEGLAKEALSCLLKVMDRKFEEIQECIRHKGRIIIRESS